MNVLLPFFDDSSLLFAVKMREELTLLGHSCTSHFMVHSRDAAHISDRQMSANIGSGPDLVAEEAALSTEFLSRYDAVIGCRVTKEIRDLVNNRAYMNSGNRPCFVAFQPGLEFTPERGVRNRRNFDVVFLNSQDDADTYGPEISGDGLKHVSWGHPYFLKPQEMRDDDGGDIFFFAQAISPKTYNGRIHVAEVLRAIAMAHPHRQVVVKLRHLPSENTNHVHREEFSYPDLFEDLWDIPGNIEVSVCTMKEALSKASLALTCTSTAAMDALSAGVPTIVYTDYVENYRDRMADAMQRIFKESGIIMPLNSVLRLDYRKPRKSWVDRNFRDRSIYQELTKSVLAFQASKS